MPPIRKPYTEIIIRYIEITRKIILWSISFPERMVRVMTDDLKRIVGLKIRAERLARGMTQEQLSEHIERTVETVSNLERGKAWPGLESLLKICNVLQLSLAHLFEDEGAAPPTRRRVELLAHMKVLMDSLTDNDLEIAVRQVEVLANGRQRS